MFNYHLLYFERWLSSVEYTSPFDDESDYQAMYISWLETRLHEAEEILLVSSSKEASDGC